VLAPGHRGRGAELSASRGRRRARAGRRPERGAPAAAR
jgi:hypothetical protein